MCGIFGYLNFNCRKTRREILGTLVNGLKRMEYRGYDSAGIVTPFFAPFFATKIVFYYVRVRRCV